jgi:16S rRNA processing protein RimM
MAHKGYFEFGKVIKPHSFNGAVKLKITHPLAELIEIPESVFIEINTKLVPFFISDFSEQNPPFAICSFEGITTENQARDLSGNFVYFPDSLQPELEGNEFYVDEIIGFSVHDEDHGDIGVLDNVMEGPAQDIFEITHPSGKEIMVPVIDDFIVEIDRGNKILYLAAPEGLIDFYLE